MWRMGGYMPIWTEIFLTCAWCAILLFMFPVKADWTRVNSKVLQIDFAKVSSKLCLLSFLVYLAVLLNELERKMYKHLAPQLYNKIRNCFQHPLGIILQKQTWLISNFYHIQIKLNGQPSYFLYTLVLPVLVVGMCHFQFICREDFLNPAFSNCNYAEFYYAHSYSLVLLFWLKYKGISSCICKC